MSRVAHILASAHERTTVRVPGPSSRQPRDHRTVPQGKSGHAPACKRWTPEGGVARTAKHDRPRTHPYRCRCAPTTHGTIRTHPVRRHPGTSPAGFVVLTDPLAVLPLRGPSGTVGRRRRLSRHRFVHRLLPRNGGGRLALVMAGMRGLPRSQFRHRSALGRPTVPSGPTQPDERHRHPQRRTTGGA